MANPLIKINKKYELLFKIFDYPQIRYIVITGGRGSSKSFTVSTWLSSFYLFGKGRKALFTRYTMNSAKKSIIPEFEEKLINMNLIDFYSSTAEEIINAQTKSNIIFSGIKTSSGNQTAKLKSIPGITCFILEEAEEYPKEEEFDTIDLSVRTKGEQNLVIFMMNKGHESHWILRRFFKDKNVTEGFNGILGDTLYIHTSYLDNIDNLSESFLLRAKEMKEKNPRKYNNIFLGFATSLTEGSLWQLPLHIEPYRVKKLPDLKRIIVGVDPSVSDDKKNDLDECGIVICGLGFDNHFYVLEDKTGQYSNAEWGRIAVGALKNWAGDRIIAEKNNGGDLVRMNLKNIDINVPVTLVTATKGKMLRAEPIAALYEEGRVHHYGEFYKLETEMTTYTGVERSPNGLDALVWAMTELSGQNNKRVGVIDI